MEKIHGMCLADFSGLLFNNKPLFILRKSYRTIV